jgi:hypothetical protein
MRNRQIAAISIDGNFFVNSAFFPDGSLPPEARNTTDGGGFDASDPRLPLIRNVGVDAGDTGVSDAGVLFSMPMLVTRLPFGGSFADVFFSPDALSAPLGVSASAEEGGGATARPTPPPSCWTTRAASC